MRLMRTALAINALFSGATGTVAATRADHLSTRLGVEAWMLVGLGIGLIGFAVGVALIAGSGSPRRAIGVVVADIAWVAVALPIAITGPGSITGTGRGALAIVTAIVAGLAASQWVGVRRVESAR